MKDFQFPLRYIIITVFLFKIMVLPTLRSEIYNANKTLSSSDEHISNETSLSSKEYLSNETLPSPDEYLNSVSMSLLRLHNLHRALFDIPVLHLNTPLVNKSKRCAESGPKLIDGKCQINLEINTHIHDLRDGRLTADDVFDKWCKESELITDYTAMEKDYAYANLSAFMNYSHIFWRTTTEIGCNGAYNNTTHIIVTVCLYYPKAKLKNNYDENLFLPLLVGRTRHKKYYSNESYSIFLINYPAILVLRLFIIFTLPLIFLIESRRKVQATLSMTELYTIENNIRNTSTENPMTSKKDIKSRRQSKMKKKRRNSQKNDTATNKKSKRKNSRIKDMRDDGSERRTEPMTSKEKTRDTNKIKGTSTTKRTKGKNGS